MPKDKHFLDDTPRDVVEISQHKFQLIVSVLQKVHESLGTVVELLQSQDSDMASSLQLLTDKVRVAEKQLSSAVGDTIIEGVFDGERMIDHEGGVYQVPANYASKSKLVEGDILKLTVTVSGDYIFKQIAPVDRKRVVGTLAIEENSGQYYVMADNKVIKVNPAAVTYYKGVVGDEVIVLVPKDGSSQWGAVENIIKV